MIKQIVDYEICSDKPKKVNIKVNIKGKYQK